MPRNPYDELLESIGLQPEGMVEVQPPLLPPAPEVAPPVPPLRYPDEIEPLPPAPTPPIAPAAPSSEIPPMPAATPGPNMMQQLSQQRTAAADELKAAQEQRAKNLAALQIMRGSQRVAGGLAKGYGGQTAPIDTTLGEKLAGQEVKDIEERRAAAQKQRKSLLEEMYAQEAIAERDPNSPESEKIRQMVSKAFPEDRAQFSGASGKQLRDYIEIQSKLKKSEMDPYKIVRAQYLRDRLEETKKRRELSEEIQEWKVKEKDELSDKQTEALTSLQETMDALDNLAVEKASIDTGPLSAAQSWTAQKFGIDDPNKSAFKASILDNISKRVKALSGTAASDKERAWIAETLPAMTDNDASFTAKLNEARKRLNMVYERKVKGFTGQGKQPGKLQIPEKLERFKTGQDKKIQDYADTYFGGDYNKAKKLLETRGYKAKGE